MTLHQGYLKDASEEEVEQFWLAYQEIKRDVMAAAADAGNGEMKFFTYYSYEAILNSNIWSKLVPNKDNSDLYVFSSYPTGRTDLSHPFPAGTGASFPQDFYDAIVDNFGTKKPIGFFELGQPHENTSNNPYDVGADGEADQNNWMTAFFNSIENLNVEFISYWIPYDTDLTSIIGGNTFFNKMGLRSGADAPLASWNTFVSHAGPLNPSKTQTLLDSMSNTVITELTPGEVKVDIPSHSFGTNVSMTLQSTTIPSSNASAAADLRGTGVGVSISLDQSLQPVNNVTVTIQYRDSDVAGFDESLLVIARYDSTQGIWVPLRSTPNPSSNQVSGLTKHFSIFQVMQQNATASVDNGVVYPIPFRPKLGHDGITFSNFPSGANVKILTINGSLVYEFHLSGLGAGTWDVKNKSGQDVASGVYFVLIEGKGSNRKLKIVVQR